MIVSTQELLFVRDLRDPYETRFQHARSVNAGSEHRVFRGVYLPTSVWEQLNPDERYLAKVRAVAGTRRTPQVLSHWSAAVIHRLPHIGHWPWEVHFTTGFPGSGRARHGIITHVHGLRDEDVVEIDGLLVTSLERTILDVAAQGGFMDAVAMADRAIHVDRHREGSAWTTKQALYACMERQLPFRNHARVRQVFDFSTELADSPLESASRVNMRVIGCPRPILQAPYSDYLGFVGECDFTWPDQKLLGEADGDLKYLDERYRGDRTGGQVLVDEKRREDRLRALGWRVTRWPWSVGIDPGALRRHLVDAGLPMGLRW